MLVAVQSLAQDTGCRSRGAANIKPMRYVRGTAIRRTLQQIPPALVTRDFDLSSGKNSLAYYAHTFVIERAPFAQPIRFAKNIETLFRSEMFLHDSF